MIRPKLLVLVAAPLALAWGLGGWFLPGPLPKDTEFAVKDGESFNTVAEHLHSAGAVSSPLSLMQPCSGESWGLSASANLASTTVSASCWAP